MATAARKTFLTIGLLRLVVTQRYANGLGTTTSRVVNLLVPYAISLAKSIAKDACTRPEHFVAALAPATGIAN